MSACGGLSAKCTSALAFATRISVLIPANTVAHALSLCSHLSLRSLLFFLFFQTQVERDAEDADLYASHADRGESGTTDALPTHEPRETPAHDGRIRAHAQRRTTAAAGPLTRHAMSCARAPAAAATVHFVLLSRTAVELHTPTFTV